MGNRISYDARAGAPLVRMSNARTFLFMLAMSLAASALAREDNERELAVWFAARDQNVFGLGSANFDISEMPWHPDSFAADRDFALRAIDRAKTGEDWKRYGWRIGALDDEFESFKAMVASFAITDAVLDPARTWKRVERPNEFHLCPRHAVYLHSFGCPLCNDRWQ
jgi:hypothetical protein